MYGVALTLVIVLAAAAARADRPVTAEERVAIVAALEAEGCSGGTYEYDDDDDHDDDDGKFEVDDARCADGTYDFELSRDFHIKERDRDD
jgi:Fe-S cluster assembly iron-binding protein IscA